MAHHEGFESPVLIVKEPEDEDEGKERKEAEEDVLSFEDQGDEAVLEGVEEHRIADGEPSVSGDAVDTVQGVAEIQWKLGEDDGEGKEQEVEGGKGDGNGLHHDYGDVAIDEEAESVHSTDAEEEHEADNPEGMVPGAGGIIGTGKGTEGDAFLPADKDEDRNRHKVADGTEDGPPLAGFAQGLAGNPDEEKTGEDEQDAPEKR